MQKISGLCADYGQTMLALGLISALATAQSACQTRNDSAAAIASEIESAYRCGEHGFLTTELFGELEARLQWTAADLECEGMPRPNGDGARLRFAGDVGDGRQIAFIIALPKLRRGDTGMEYQTTVTVIEEGNGRFFSSADVDICWTDISGLENIDDSESNYVVSGNLYCIAPLTQINGDSDVIIRDLDFRGLLDWNAS